MILAPAPFLRASACLGIAALALAACQSPAPAPDRFAQADRDGNGALTAAEVSDYFVNAIFDARDTDKDGRITKAEWNPQMDAVEAREFVLRDTNNDGAVTREEATAYARRRGLYTKETREADTNKDGLLSRAEVTAYYASKE